MRVRLLRDTFIGNTKHYTGEVVDVSPATAGRWIGKGMAIKENPIRKAIRWLSGKS